MSPLTRRVLFRIHWIAGLGAGAFLLVIGLTGALLGLASPITRVLNPQLQVTHAPGQATLGPDAWIASARTQAPGLQPLRVNWNGPARAVDVRMGRAGQRGGVPVTINPYSGQVLTAPRGEAFFHAVERLHRTLGAGPIGKQMVAASTVLLLLLAITGLVLRWPRRHRWSTWLTLDGRRRGRGLLWQLHSAAGTWALLCYLLVSLTGLWWSYDVYRDTLNRLAGVQGSMRPPRPATGTAPPAALDAAWAGFRRAVPDATRAMVIPGRGDAPVQMRYQTADSAHGRAWSSVTLARSDGRVIARQDYASLPRGRRFIGALFPLHSGEWFGWPGRLVMILASLALPGFTVTGVWMWLSRRRRRKTSQPPRVRHVPRRQTPDRLPG